MNKSAERLLLLILFLAYLAQGMASIQHASLTFDEGPHLAAGYTTLRTGDYRLQPVHIHPPLANVIAAAPLLLQSDLPDPTTIPGWQVNSLSAVTDSIVWKYPYPEHIATAGRVPMLLCGFLLAALTYRWAKKCGGRVAGVIALTLYAFDPNIIAHSSLITTDIVVTGLSTATLYMAAMYLFPRGPDKRQPQILIFTGLFLGLTMLSKVSALILFPVIGLAIFVKEDIYRRSLFHSLWRTAYLLFVLVVVAVGVLWAGYGFEITRPPGLPFPIPAWTHLEIYSSLTQHYQLGHPAFANGMVSTKGWWWYFPFAFMLKTPVPTLLLLLASTLVTIRFVKNKTLNNRKPVLSSHILMAAWVTFYAFSSLFSSVNIGYRHLLPLLPCLYIFTGESLSNFWYTTILHKPTRIKRIFSGCIVGLLCSLVLGILQSVPSPLDYFNLIAGGQRGGYRYLVDSNLDWGQNLWDLQRWMGQAGVDQVKYAHYSPASPEQYGILADFLPPDPRAVSFTPWHPEPGVYVIGATVLQGVYTPDVNTYAFFRNKTPVSRIGGALFIYQVAERAKPEWVVSCQLEPAEEAIRRSLAKPDIRVVYIDCSKVQVYPTSSGHGLYIVQPEMNAPIQGYKDFDLVQNDGQVWRSIYRVHQPPSPETKVSGADLDGPLEFIGYAIDIDLVKPGSKLLLTTFWQVKDIPHRPLSLLAHLVAPSSNALSTGDGMGFPIEEWSVGDVIVQSHQLEIPGTIMKNDKLTLMTGGYWLDTNERWPTQHVDNILILDEFVVK